MMSNARLQQSGHFFHWITNVLHVETLVLSEYYLEHGFTLFAHQSGL